MTLLIREEILCACSCLWSCACMLSSKECPLFLRCLIVKTKLAFSPKSVMYQWWLSYLNCEVWIMGIVWGSSGSDNIDNCKTVVTYHMLGVIHRNRRNPEKFRNAKIVNLYFECKYFSIVLCVVAIKWSRLSLYTCIECWRRSILTVILILCGTARDLVSDLRSRHHSGAARSGSCYATVHPPRSKVIIVICRGRHWASTTDIHAMTGSLGTRHIHWSAR